MYPVSNDYLDQIKRPYGYKRTLRGTIGDVAFTDDDVLSGSLTISNQCSDSGEVQIGFANVGMLEATFRDGLIERTEWQGKTITLSEGLYIERTSSYEYVPLGVYVVDNATWDKNGIKVTAYDYMHNFDKDFNLSTTVGSPYSVLSLLCQDCEVTLGMTKAQIEALPNGTQSIALFSENDCETYRDVLFWLAQTLCSCATISRDGKLILIQYGRQTIDSISAGLRFNDNEFSDWETEYSGIAFVDIESGEYIYVAGDEDNKLTYKLGSNPFMQYGTMTTRRQMARNILNGLKAVKYVPFNCTMLHTPAYDLGDVIVFTEGIAPGKQSCIMFYEYTFGTYAAEGFGQNPALATAKNKSDKNIAGLMSKVNKDSIQFYTFKNAEAKTVGDGQTQELINIRFSTIDQKQVTFQGEILVDADVTLDEVEANIRYFLDGAEILDYQPTETWSEDGKHIISLYYVIDVEPNTLYRWQVFLNSVGGVLTIPVENARGTIWGQGLVASDKWDGYIDAEDRISAIPIDDSISIVPFTDEAELELVEWIDIQAEDTIGAIPVDDSIEVAPFEDSVYIDKTSLYFEGFTWGDIKDDLWGDVLDEHVW